MENSFFIKKTLPETLLYRFCRWTAEVILIATDETLNFKEMAN
jgi:hypothetical protein